jgi:hypothetical protein
MMDSSMAVMMAVTKAATMAGLTAASMALK